MSDAKAIVRHAYRERPTRFVGVRDVAGYRFKVYAISFDGRDPAPGVFDAGWRAIAPTLPRPAVTAERFGVGFAVEHRGRGEDYLVVCWWDKENELFNRVATTTNNDAAGWAVAAGGHVGCVWDLRVIGFERDAYCDVVLGCEGPPDLDGYTSQVLGSSK